MTEQIRSQKYVINNWVMLLKELAEILYDESSTPINEFTAKDLSKKPLLSTNPQIYSKPLEIANGVRWIF